MTSKLIAFIKLMRVNKPTAYILLSAPFLITLAQLKITSLSIYFLFSLGAFFGRSFGCVLNDYFDQEIDSRVERTKKRPLASKELSNKDAFLIGFLLLIGCLCTMFFIVNQYVFYACLFSLGLIILYPLSKRFFFAPQLILGLTFSSSIPILYAAIKIPLDITLFSIILANTLWVISYDTFYAAADYEDDLKINIFSLSKSIGLESSLFMARIFLIISHFIFLQKFYSINKILTTILFIFFALIFSLRIKKSVYIKNEFFYLSFLALIPNLIFINSFNFNLLLIFQTFFLIWIIFLSYYQPRSMYIFHLNGFLGLGWFFLKLVNF